MLDRLTTRTSADTITTLIGTVMVTLEGIATIMAV